MKTTRGSIADGLAVALITVGLLWGAARLGSVHAQLSRITGAPPKIENGKLQSHPLTGSLSNSIHQWAAGTSRPEWLGYAVAEAAGDRTLCCWQNDNRDGAMNNCGSCSLEAERNNLNIHSRSADGRTRELEAPGQLLILYRAEAGKLNQIRLFSAECSIDAGGLPVVWLEGVKPADSVKVLEQFVDGQGFDDRGADKFHKSALTAIALHADPSADRAMESFVAPEEPVSLRRESAFWLGEARGAEGLRVLRKMAGSDSSPAVREQVAFALSISREPGALPDLIRMAHDDPSSPVRGQALFWLGQKAGAKAAGAITSAITGAIENDPDTEVKKKAVFALSQMSPEQGVPKLIEVAQTNHNPQIRKEAMFWLGQSEAPQALAFFEKVLSQ